MTPEQEKGAVETMARAAAAQNWFEKGYRTEGEAEKLWDSGHVLNKAHYRKRAKAEFTALQAFLKEQGLAVVRRKSIDALQPYLDHMGTCNIHDAGECSCGFERVILLGE